MRILYIAKFSDIHSSKWAKFFDKDHDVFRYNVDGFKISHIWKIRRAIKWFKPDVTHVQYCGVNGLLGALSGAKFLIGTVHGSEVLLTKGLKRWLVKWVLSKCDLITTDGRHVEMKILKWGIDVRKIRHINFGVDCEKFMPMLEYRLANNLIPFISYRVGDGKTYDIDTIQKTERLVKNATFKPIKNLLPEEMPNMLNDSAIYVSTALSDAGLSSTTAEAMACGLPVLITDVGDNSRWVPKGCLFKPGDHKALAEKIIYLLREPEKRVNIGLQNREIIRCLNNYNDEMEKMNEIYKEIHNGKRKKESDVHSEDGNDGHRYQAGQVQG